MHTWNAFRRSVHIWRRLFNSVGGKLGCTHFSTTNIRIVTASCTQTHLTPRPFHPDPGKTFTYNYVQFAQLCNTEQAYTHQNTTFSRHSSSAAAASAAAIVVDVVQIDAGEGKGALRICNKNNRLCLCCSGHYFGIGFFVCVATVVEYTLYFGSVSVGRTRLPVKR